MSEPIKIITIGEWTATPALNSLERNGKQVKLEPRAMDLLVYLAEHAGEVVSADDALAHVWGGRAIESSAVYKRINQLRKALDDDSQEPTYIQTIPKRGYRLIAGVVLRGADKVDADSDCINSTSPARLAWLRGLAATRKRSAILLTGTLTALMVVFSIALFQRPPAETFDKSPGRSSDMPRARLSIAVLPFAYSSRAGEDVEFMADGLHAELLTRLSHTGGFRVIARGSVMQYRDEPRSLEQIARELGVGSILEGVVHQAADRVRVNVRLIDASSSEQIWADSYEGAMTAAGVFEMQSAVALAIVEALDAQLTDAELRYLRDPPTDSSEAYNYYLSGMDYLRSSDFVIHLPLAIQQLEKAVAADPEFALAWAALSVAQNEMPGFGPRAEELRVAAVASAERALALDPSLPEARVAMAQCDATRGRHDAALRELELAEETGAAQSELLMVRAIVYEHLEEWDDALTALHGVLDLDPRNVSQMLIASRIYTMLRRYEDAERLIDRALEIAPDSDFALLAKSRVGLYRDGDVSFMKELASSRLYAEDLRLQAGWQSAVQERDYDLALEFLRRLDRNSDTFGLRPITSYLGLTHELAGRNDLARRQFELTREQAEAALVARPDDPNLLLMDAEALVRLDEPARAVETAKRAVARMAPPTVARSGTLRAIGWVFVPAGDIDTALEALDRYLASPAPFSIEGLMVNPQLDPMRDDPRFLEIVERYRRR